MFANFPNLWSKPGALDRLRLILSRSSGTVTAGNSCPLTDGAAAMVLTSARHAQHRSDAHELGVVSGGETKTCDEAGLSGANL